MPKRSGIIPVMATLGALGVVYGDIGTSPLYALRERPGRHPRRHGDAGRGAGDRLAILWALILIIRVNTPFSILRATTTAKAHRCLAGLLSAARRAGTLARRASGRGLVGAALLYGMGHHAGDFRSQHPRS